MTEDLQKVYCREHHFKESGRCSFCQIQSMYYHECMSMLDAWPRKEKKKDWQEKVELLRCTPHEHK